MKYNYLEQSYTTMNETKPCWGPFTFSYKKRSIHVPTFLNNVARYKPDSFWDWLIEKEPYGYITMTYQHIVDEEQSHLLKNLWKQANNQKD